MTNQTSQQIATFSVEVAKQLIKKGFKISHHLWNPKEFIAKHWRDGYYQNEEGKLIDGSKFWQYRFETGYFIFDENATDEDDFVQDID